VHVEKEHQKVLYSKHFVTSQKCPYDVTFPLDLDLEHVLDGGSNGDHLVQVWWRSSHFSARKSDIREITKVSVSRDLDLDLEHTLDVVPCGDHHVQVWWGSSHFCGRSSDLRKKVYRQTDRQTDGRRTPRDCISSWNELKNASPDS